MIRSILFLMMLLPLLYSCDNKENRLIVSQLDAADSLCSVDPNKASLLIKSLEADVTKSQNSNYYRWLLLNIKATDKADIPLTSDSIIKDIVSFFDANDDINCQIESYYYLGRTYVEMHDSPRALSAFKKALELSEKYDYPKPIIAIHTCAQLSGIYILQNLLHEALLNSQKEYAIAKRFNLLTPRYIIGMATCYHCLDDTAHAIKYYDLTLRNILREKSTQNYLGLICQMLGYYSNINHKYMADSCYALIKRNEVVPPPVNYNASKADYFEAFGPLDSAINYNLRDLYDPSDLIGRKDAAKGLMKTYRRLGNYELSSLYGMIYANTVDSLHIQLMLDQTRNAHNEYQYHRDLLAEEEVYHKASETKLISTIIVSIVLILLLTGVLFYKSYQQRMERELAKTEDTVQDLRQQRQLLSNQLIHSTAMPNESAIITTFNYFASNYQTTEPTEKDWSQLIKFVNKHYSGFELNVVDKCPKINDTDLRIAHLLKLGFSNIEIETIMHMTHSTTFRHITKLRKTLFDVL